LNGATADQRVEELGVSDVTAADLEGPDLGLDGVDLSSSQGEGGSSTSVSGGRQQWQQRRQRRGCHQEWALGFSP
jgi:hypothetical protein